jgi:CheY-like chemotaxis protein
MSNEPYHILLVDDDDVTNFLSKEMLRLYMASPKIDITLNGQDAIDYLVERAGEPDRLPNLILLDINMPIMDGWDFLAEFDKVKKPGFEKINIIMFTSSVYYEDIDRARTYATVKNIYSKPLDEQKIREIIASCP